MSTVFESVSINQLRLKNRFVRSATNEGMARKDGTVTNQLVRHLNNLVQGGVGLIISGFSYVSNAGKGHTKMLGIHHNNVIPGLCKITDTVHAGGGTIIAQIAHAGCRAKTATGNGIPFGPSEMIIPEKLSCREITRKEISFVIEDFIQAAIRAKCSGFDGIQIHAAHGFLISQFLSPFYNKRSDEYGGTVENRARLLLEILIGIRDELGKNYPILVKINSEDFLEPGLTKNEMIQMAKMLEQKGVDAIEISGGTNLSPKEYRFSRKTGVVPQDKEVYFREAAKLFKQNLKIPLILVGGVRSFGVAENLIRNGTADFISLCRPLIREPHLVNRWESGDTNRSSCISCNQCFIPVRSGRGVYCVAEKQYSSKK